MPEKILVFAPHPDDAEWYAGGTLAHMAQQGDQILIVTVTDGGCGSFEFSRSDLVRLRALEAARAAHVLGVEIPVLLGYPDQGLDLLPPGVLREHFIRLIRQHRPDVVVAEDILAQDEVHPDHRAVARAVSEALNYATLPLVHPEHIEAGLQTHFVREKYFYGAPLEKANKIIDISQTMPLKLAALAEHATQMRFLVDDVLRQAGTIPLNFSGLDALEMLPANDPAAMVGWALQAEAAQVGAQIGVQYAEAFRYVRFHPFIENLISG